MAGKVIYFKVAAYTLLETVIAMVVIISVSGIAMAIFLRVTQTSLSGTKLQAAALASNALQQAERKKTRKDSSYTTGDLHIIQSVDPYPGFSGLVILQVSTLDLGGDTLISVKKVIENE